MPPHLRIAQAGGEEFLRPGTVAKLSCQRHREETRRRYAPGNIRMTRGPKVQDGNWQNARDWTLRSIAARELGGRDRLPTSR